MDRAGGKVTGAELRAYAVTIGKPIQLAFENSVTLFTSNNPQGGAVAAWLAEQGFDDGGLLNSSRLDQRKFADNIGQAYRGLAAGAPLRSNGSSSIAVIDQIGRATRRTPV